MAKAVKMQNTERVREFNSAIHLTKVVKERDQQLELNQVKRDYEAYINEKHHEQLMNNLKQENDTVLANNYKLLMKSKHNSTVVREQVLMEEQKKTLNAKIESNQDKEILKNAMDEMHRDKIKEDQKRFEKINLAKETIETNKKQQKIVRLQEKQEKEEEKRIEEWNKQRELKQQAFNDKQIRKRKEVQEVRSKMIDKQAELLTNLQNKDKARLESQIKHKEKQAIQKFKEDMQRKEENKLNVKKYNKRMVEFKQNQLNEIKETDKV